jgi:hypothetical protein
MDNVQKHNVRINAPSSQNLEFIFLHELKANIPVTVAERSKA